MARQNLKAREAAILLDSLTGKLTIEMLADVLEEAGHIDMSPEAMRTIRLELARKVVQEARRYRRSENDDVQMELVNLFETTATGEKEHYYRHFNEMTIEEAAKLLTVSHDREMQTKKQFIRYAVPLIHKFGRDALEHLVDFDLPSIRKPKALPA